MIENVIVESLFQNDSSLIIKESERKNIIIAAPHHAKGGVKELPCITHKDSDENTGLIAFEIASNLNTSFIIACNASTDPNKTLETDYSKQIIEWNPKFLIEIHGHGGKRVSENVIEISCGSIEKNHLSIIFAKTLQNKLTHFDNLKKFIINGNFEEIKFRATNTATITDNRWCAFHIELPPSLRLNNDNCLPEYISEFINALSETISEVCL